MNYSFIFPPVLFSLSLTNLNFFRTRSIGGSDIIETFHARREIYFMEGRRVKERLANRVSRGNVTDRLNVYLKVYEQG